MKRLQPFVFSAALLLLAACGQDTQPEAAAPSFNFSVDPAAGSVNLTSADAQTLKALQVGECGSGEPRILFPEEELALTSYNAAFLPGNLLEITAEFTNVTDFTFEQPFTFTQAESTSNIVSSQEPEVTDADLGGDGALSPDETTSTLSFTVEHRGQPFTYEVFAEAVVSCGDGDGGPTDPVDPVDPVDPSPEADLEVIKTGDAEVTLDENGEATLNYSVIVTNSGTADATGVELTDTISASFANPVGGVTADISAVLPLPDGCAVETTFFEGLVVLCTIGDLAAGASTVIDLSFDLSVTGELGADNSITVTNSAIVGTDTEESDDMNNFIDFETVVTAPAPAEPVLPDLTVVKTGDTEVALDENGNGTVNYSVTVTNNGEAVAEGVELTDTFAIDLSAFAGDVTADLSGTVLPDGCIVDADASVGDTLVATCTLGALESGGSTTLDFSFDVDLLGDLTLIDGPIAATNTADTSTTTEEGDLTNNSAVVESTLTVTPVAALADLAVTKTGDATVETDANGDATLNYTVTVTNNGEAVAEGTALTDTFTIDLSALGGVGEVTATVLPDGCIIDADASVGGTEVVTCTLGALASGESSTLDFSFAVDLPADVALGSSFPVTNTADATTTTDENDLTNNNATVDSTVTTPVAGV